LYFLLRKGWIEDRSDYIRKIFEDRTRHNLYQEVLAPLFFDVFAKPEKERPERIRQQFKNTPYLNGGLFEHSDLEHEMAKERIMIFYRDDFLRDIILNYFEIYNFTVDENTPTDQEVSIDPEMLGKVFENTLAEDERNKKGTFYTPREVVHFMVIDAIKQYLHNETGISLKTLQMLIDDEQDKLDYLTPNQIRQIDKKLEDIKVLDPATGSAAFPVELMNVIIQLRKRLDVKVGRNINEVSLKKHLIKNSLYGVDVDPGAIEIAKLRLWLALIVDYDKSLAEPLPNLDFQFRVGNALQEKIDGIDIFNEQIEGTQISYLSGDQKAQQLKEQMINVKDRFYLTENEADKHRLKEEFDQLERQLISHARESYEKAYLVQMQNQKFAKTAQKAQETLKKLRSLDQKIKDGTYKLFKPDFHFSEVYDRKDEHGNNVNGFDIVIGNPPYGVLVDKDIQEQHQLGSRDSYGIFISTALKRFLKDGGVLELIVSDTWLTIKTHRNLRQQVLENRIHKIIRLDQDCFNATVNVCILSISKLPCNDNQLIAADLTNISTRKASQELREKLFYLENHIGKSTPKYAVYQYQQALIKTNSNLPIFVASPKLFTLMQDVDVASITKTIGGKQVAVRQIYMIGKLIELVRFGYIAEVKVGLQQVIINHISFRTLVHVVPIVILRHISNTCSRTMSFWKLLRTKGAD
jgi:type I restriction-modification system DNA methylase subunit